MLKKVIFSVAIVMFLLILIVPVAAFASNPPAGKQIVLPDDPPTGHPKPDASDIIFATDDSSDSEDALPETSATEKPSFVTNAVASAKPTKITKSLGNYDNGYYSTAYNYTAPATGIYIFEDIEYTRYDSNIYIYDTAGRMVAEGSEIADSFLLLAVLEKGNKYRIEIDCHKDKSITYLLSTPATLSNTAYTMSSNGYSYAWYQSFNVNFPVDDIYSFHFTCPANCSYYVFIYDDNYELYYWYDANKEVYDFDIFPAGNYHIVVRMINNSSKKDTYSVSMDAEGRKHIANGVPVNCSLSTNDMLTTNAFGASETGRYRFTCSRSDAKLTLYDFDAERFTPFNVSANTVLNMTKDNSYMVFLSTNGSSGSMQYSLTYLSPDATITGISTSLGTLSPAYNKGIKNYELKVDSEAASSVTITPRPAAPGGTFVINGSARSSISVLLMPLRRRR